MPVVLLVEYRRRKKKKSQLQCFGNWVEQFGDKAREVRLRWSGHVYRRDSGYIWKRMLKTEISCRKERRLVNIVKCRRWCDRQGC